MTWPEILLGGALTGLLLLLGIIGKLIYHRISEFHTDAMNHLTRLTVSVDQLGSRIDEHIRDHATGAFRQREPE